MFGRIHQILWPPLFEGDEDQTRVAGQLNTITLVILASATLYVIAYPIFAPQLADRFFLALPLFPFLIGILVLIRYGHVRLASALLVSGLWILLIGYATVSGGVRATGFSGLIIVVLGAGILLGRPAACGFAALSILAGLLMVYSEARGTLPAFSVFPSALVVWSAQAVYFVVAAALLHLALQNINDSLARARMELDQRKRAQETLREQEERYRALMEQSVEAIYLYDTEMKNVVEANPAFLKLLGYTAEEAHALTLYDIVAHSRENIDAYFHQLLTEGVLNIGARQWRRKDGGIVDVEVTVGKIRQVGKDIVFAVARDITERKRAETALRETEERFRSLSEAAFEGIMIHDQGVVLDANQALADLLGFPHPEDLIGKNGLATPPLTPESLELVKTNIQSGTTEPFDITLRKPDGSICPAETQGREITYKGRKARVVALRDITERKRAEEEKHRQAVEMTALYETTHDLVIEQDLSKLLHTIVERAARLLEASGGGLYLCEPEQDQVRCVVSYNTAPYNYTGVILKYGEGAAGIVAETGEPLIIDDYRAWQERAAMYEQDQPFVSVLSVPMRWQDHVIGVIHILDDTRPRAFTRENLQLVTLFANQAAIAVENARLFETEQRRRQESAAIAEVGRDISATLQLDLVLERIAFYAKDLLHAETSAVYLSEPAQSVLRAIAAIGPDADEIKQDPRKMGEGILGHIAAQKVGEIVNDTAADQRTIMIKGTEMTPFEHIMGAPVLSKEQLTGLIVVWRAGAGQEFKSTDLDFLSALAGQAAVAIENARLFDEARRRADEFAALYETARELADTQHLPSLLQIIVNRASALFTAPSAAIFLHDPVRHDLELAFSSGPQLRVGTRLAQGEGMAGQVAQTHQPLIVDDYHTWPERSPQFEAIPFSADLQVPLLYHGELIGVLDVSDIGPTTRRFTDADARLLSLFAAQAATAVHDTRLLETLELRVAERTRELAEANERLTELDRLKSKFVSDVSHELRTPVANLNLYLNLLERGKLEKRAEYMTVLRQQAARLTQLIEDILDLSRLEAGAAQAVFESLDLNELAAQVVSAQRPVAQAKGLVFHFAPEENLPTIRGGANPLTQVITNLVANAINYTRSGSVTVSTRAENDQVLFQVQDTGMGIDQEDLPHLFERFYRGRHTAQSTTPRTGLGLAIVKEIIEAQGGQIEVESQPGQGSIFSHLAADRENPAAA